MKQGKRKLRLDRTSIRPLNPQQLANIAGGTGLQIPTDGECNDQQGSFQCNGSCTQNYSNDVKCG